MDYLRKHRARALVVVDNRSDLGHLLRDAEGPAHEKWRADAPRLKEKGWPAAAERVVREVQNAAARILDALAGETGRCQAGCTGRSLPGRYGQAPRPRPGTAGSAAGSGPRTWALTPHRPCSGRVSPQAGPGSEDPSGKTFDVRMAYDVVRGTTRTAFSRFDSGLRAGHPDFSLKNGQLRLQSDECEADVRSENKFHLRVRGPDFSLRVTGFDERDLVVKVAQIEADITVDRTAEARGAMIRRFNRTGRVSIPSARASVTLRRVKRNGGGQREAPVGVQETVWCFDLRLDLAGYRFPSDALVRVEAWRGNCLPALGVGQRGGRELDLSSGTGSSWTYRRPAVFACPLSRPEIPVVCSALPTSYGRGCPSNRYFRWCPPISAARCGVWITDRETTS